MENIKIYKGQSSTLKLNVEPDLTGFKVFVTISGIKTFVKECDSAELTEDGSEITFTLTQEETMKMTPGRQKLQFRAVKGDDSLAPPPYTIVIEPAVYDGVLTDGS